MRRANKLSQLEGSRNVGEFEENGVSWRNFAKVFDEMRRANKLTQLEGPQNVRENGEFGENGDSGKISPRSLMK